MVKTRREKIEERKMDGLLSRDVIVRKYENNSIRRCE
jgi:hypothetical protein|nr:MAG TPA: hypothetical protein [Caudoviricetes sp.]